MGGCRYEVFRGLSLPLVKVTKAGITSWLSAGSKPISIHDCLAAFTADEVRPGALGQDTCALAVLRRATGAHASVTKLGFAQGLRNALRFISSTSFGNVSACCGHSFPVVCAQTSACACVVWGRPGFWPWILRF